jgi:hypothetical protein
MKNILFDKQFTDDTDSEQGTPKFRKNNISQEEIEAKMFENPTPKRQKNKVRPKALFANVSIKTPAFQWKIDQEWKIKCNPGYQLQETAYLHKDRKMLEKRRYGKVLKNQALEKDLEIKNKRLDRELKKDLF